MVGDTQAELYYKGDAIRRGIEIILNQDNFDECNSYHETAPENLLKVPTEQLAQSVLPVDAENLPGRHKLHECDPLSLFAVPKAHRKQDVAASLSL